jgi:hypothetical protein
VQTWPQSPQLTGSLKESTHALLQIMASPALQPQTPFPQTPVMPEHVLSHDPQWASLMRGLMQTPPQHR